jgi:carbamoyltransferase
MREYLNNSVKRREWYRPYGVAVMEERAEDVVLGGIPSPAMMLAAPATPEARRSLAGVVHVDGSLRYQTVSRTEPTLMRAVLDEWVQATGVAALINTSFNAGGDPIVETPEEALVAFAEMPIDALAIGDVLLEKTPPSP